MKCLLCSANLDRNEELIEHYDSYRKIKNSKPIAVSNNSQ